MNWIHGLLHCNNLYFSIGGNGQEQQRSIPKCSIYCISLISGAQLTVQDLILHYTSYLDEGPGKSIPRYSVQKHGHSFGLRCLVQGLWQFLGEDRPSRLGPKAWPSAYSSILSQFMKIFLHLLHFPIHCTTRRTGLMLSTLREGQNRKGYFQNFSCISSVEI